MRCSGRLLLWKANDQCAPFPRMQTRASIPGSQQRQTITNRQTSTGGFSMAKMTATQRAAQIWPVLALAAKNRQILTYSMLGKLIGVPPKGLGHLLESIQSYCMLKGLPALTILVVQEKTGFPGVGFRAASAEDYAKEQMKVFREDWMAKGAPSPEELAQTLRKFPSRKRNRIQP